MIHQLTYRSEATLILLPQDVEYILRMSRNRNSLKDITGCMVFKNGFSLQLLEGEKGDVKGLFDKIEYDRRHNEVVVLAEGRTTKRAFAKYHMAHFEIPASSGNKVG